MKKNFFNSLTSHTLMVHYFIQMFYTLLAKKFVRIRHYKNHSVQPFNIFRALSKAEKKSFFFQNLSEVKINVINFLNLKLESSRETTRQNFNFAALAYEEKS